MMFSVLLPLLLLASLAASKPQYGNAQFSCPQPYGYFKASNQCDQYVECKSNVPLQLSCPAGLQFNPMRQWIEYPCDAPAVVRCNPSPARTYVAPTTPAPPPPTTPAPVVVQPRDFSCPQPQGYFRTSTGCEQYVECKNSVPRTFSCPRGLYFNPQVQWTQYPCDQASKAICDEPLEIETIPEPEPATTPAPAPAPMCQPVASCLGPAPTCQPVAPCSAPAPPPPCTQCY
ncbi:protein obstructor-E-like isoform X1 [Bicyclus anynana]|uniref:Protein obstructor-E-like isoform X1 n=1 Tax=Bicyclus anynana TaxID=110368 RepID=A0ABM3LDP9_BICAN|nr:protein obstructor-E-like isoform X1 [Bicyclus anynana]